MNITPLENQLIGALENLMIRISMGDLNSDEGQGDWQHAKDVLAMCPSAPPQPYRIIDSAETA